jgi:serine/threonine-protein kinase
MHVMLNRPVAVKMINADLVTSPEIVRRFQREARAATQLNHPNVVDVYDLGQTAEGTLYIVMELVLGQSLKDDIRARGAVDGARIVHILAQVCDGLGVAHRANIIHRDLKPQNIMLTRDRAGAEVAKIVDFGIAKTFEIDTHTQLTADGSTLGTPHYMSPEQATGREIDGRSDIYSLGIILYEMLTGEVPFDDQSLPAVLIKHMSEPPAPPSQRRPDLRISPSLEAIALRCLAKDPAARYETAEQMATALRAALSTAPGDVTMPLGAAMSATPPLPSPEVAPTLPPSPPVPPAPTPAAASASGPGGTPRRSGTQPTAPLAAPLPPPPPAGSPSNAPITTRSSRGPAMLVAVFLLLLSASAVAGYWMWSRGRATEPETITAEGTPPSTSPAGGTPAVNAVPPAPPPPAPIAESQPVTPAPAPPSAKPEATPSTGSRGTEPAAVRTPDSSKTPPTGATSSSTSKSPSAPPATRPASESKPSAQTATPAPTAPSAPTAPPQPALPDNPSVSFQCRGPIEICNPLRNEMQAAFDRAGMTLRRAGADINITAEVEQTDQSTQQTFGTTVTIRTYAVQLDAEAPRFDNDTVAMPNAPSVSADARFGSERFNEYARKLSPEIVERVRAFWSKRR